MGFNMTISEEQKKKTFTVLPSKVLMIISLFNR